MNYMNLNAGAKHEDVRSVYFGHKDEIDNSITVSDERASFIIKTIMAGIPYRIYIHKGKVIKGKELITALVRCYNSSLVFIGKLYEAINGKTYEDLNGIYRSLIEEKFIEVVEISFDSKPDEIEYFLANID